jgi:hypothetical protein
MLGLDRLVYLSKTWKSCQALKPHISMKRRGICVAYQLYANSYTGIEEHDSADCRVFII